MYLRDKMVKIFISLTMTIIMVLMSSLALAVPSDWAKGIIDSANKEGILPAGFEDKCQKDISRLEFCKLVIKVYEKLKGKIEQLDNRVVFLDTVDESVMKAYQLGLIKGVTESEFAPHSSISRQEISVIITRLIESCFDNADTTRHPKYSHDDNWQIANWAKASVDYLYFHNIIRGTNNNYIQPLSNATIEEAVSMICRVYENKESFGAKTEISDKWEWQIEPIYDGLGPNTKFSGGLAAVSKNGKYGYIDRDGKVIINFQYDMAYEFSEGLARVIKNKKTGFVDKNGKVVIPIEYMEAGDFSEERVWLKKDNKYGFADKSGAIVVPFEYDYAYKYKEGLAPVKKGQKYGFIDKGASVVIPFQFSWACSFSEGFARVGEKAEYSYIDKTGKIVLDLKYDYLFDFKEGRAVVFNRDQYGVIDTSGKIIVPFNVWGIISNYSDGLARVQSNSGYEGQHGYVDLQGEKAIPNKLSFYDGEEFSEGLAAVATHVKSTDKVQRSYIDKTGNCVFPKRQKISEPSVYDNNTFYLHQFSEGMAAVVTQEGKLGFIKNPLLN